jgi:hypothetical protein
MTRDTTRIKALANFLKLDRAEMADIKIFNYCGRTLEYDGREYLVLTDYEADQKFEAALQDHFSECIAPDIPEDLVGYFDLESWIRDVALCNGRGPTLASYDGVEQEVKDEDGNEFWMFIYRLR